MKLLAKKAETWEAEMNSMTNEIKHFLIKVLCLVLLASWSFSFAEDAPDSRLAGKNAVYETAEQIYEASWMPKDTEISVLDEGIGLWNIQAMDGNNNILAYMQIDGDNEDLVVYYRKAAYELPVLNHISEQIIPKDELTEAEIKWAEEIFSTFRGSLATDYSMNCIAQMDDSCILISFGDVSEATAVLIAKTSENPNDAPELMAYVDVNFNWDVHYDGYISRGEAYEIACTACLDKWSSLPEDPLVLGESAFILFDTFGFYDEYDENEGVFPEVFVEPLWVISIQDQRADPSLEGFDPSVEFFNYPVLIDPSNGEVLEIREPERYGHG